MLTLKNLSSPDGAHRKTKRIGRGQGSGRGTQAGKGHKGQKARAGGGIRLGFEGGQMPLYRRVPKRGFKNFDFKNVYAEVSLSAIESSFKKGETVSRESLIKAGLLKGIKKTLPIKVLAKGEVSKAFNFEGLLFTSGAKDCIIKAGGKI